MLCVPAYIFTFLFPDAMKITLNIFDIQYNSIFHAQRGTAFPEIDNIW